MEGTVRTKPAVQGVVRKAPPKELPTPTYKTVIPGSMIPSYKNIQRPEPSVSAMDVVKSLPGAAVDVAGGISRFVAPALTGFTQKAGKIIGEGVAYATNKNVREKYNEGENVLPNVTDTSIKEMAVSTAAAGIEAGVFKSFPKIAQMTLAKMGGVGALQGMGFAISTGMAEEKSPEEIVQSLPSYGISGGVMAVIAPYLLPVLRADLKKVPTATKTTIKNLLEDIKTPTTAKPFNPKVVAEELTPVGEVRTQPPAIQQPQPITQVENQIDQAPSPQVVQVPRENMPVGTGDKAVSRLEARMAGKAKDISVEDAEKIGLSTYQKADHESQLIAAARFIEQKGDDVAMEVALGRKSAPDGLLQNAVFVAMQERAAQRADWALARKLASAQATRFGQELSILAKIEPDNPVVAMQEITLARAERASRGKGIIGFKKNLEAEVKASKKEVRSALKSSQLKIQEAESILQSILC